MAIYARAGVEYLWIVAGDGLARIEPFDALEVRLSRWWLASEG
jgi:hypothetical protein